MGINLQKGQKIDLTKGNSNLSELMVGLGWDMAGGLLGFFTSSNIDCDASAMLIDSNGKLKEIVSFSKLRSSCGSVKHSGDNLTGAGSGDDETITVLLKQLPSIVERIVFVVNIYACTSRKQHFGMIKNAFIRLVDKSTNQELAKYNLSEGGKDKTALILGEVYRYNGEWKFNAMGEFTNDTSISDLSMRYRS